MTDNAVRRAGTITEELYDPNGSLVHTFVLPSHTFQEYYVVVDPMPGSWRCRFLTPGYDRCGAWREPDNDNADPFDINWSGFGFSAHDDFMASYHDDIVSAIPDAMPVLMFCWDNVGGNSVSWQLENPAVWTQTQREEYAEFVLATMIHTVAPDLQDPPDPGPAYDFTYVELLNEPNLVMGNASYQAYIDIVVAVGERLQAHPDPRINSLKLIASGVSPGWGNADQVMEDWVGKLIDQSDAYVDGVNWHHYDYWHIEECNRFAEDLQKVKGWLATRSERTYLTPNPAIGAFAELGPCCSKTAGRTWIYLGHGRTRPRRDATFCRRLCDLRAKGRRESPESNTWHFIPTAIAALPLSLRGDLVLRHPSSRSPGQPEAMRLPPPRPDRGGSSRPTLYHPLATRTEIHSESIHGGPDAQSTIRYTVPIGHMSRVLTPNPVVGSRSRTRAYAMQWARTLRGSAVHCESASSILMETPIRGVGVYGHGLFRQVLGASSRSTDRRGALDNYP